MVADGADVFRGDELFRRRQRVEARFSGLIARDRVFELSLGERAIPLLQRLRPAGIADQRESDGEQEYGGSRSEGLHARRRFYRGRTTSVGNCRAAHCSSQRPAACALRGDHLRLPSRTTMPTTISAARTMPTQKPALKMPAMAEHPATVTVSSTISRTRVTKLSISPPSQPLLLHESCRMGAVLASASVNERLQSHDSRGDRPPAMADA